MHVAAGSNRQNSEVFIYVHNTGSISTYATETTAADIEYVNATASIGNHQFGDFKGFIGPVRFYNRDVNKTPAPIAAPKAFKSTLLPEEVTPPSCTFTVT